jgi:hypothetical protein
VGEGRDDRYICPGLVRGSSVMVTHRDMLCILKPTNLGNMVGQEEHLSVGQWGGGFGVKSF